MTENEYVRKFNTQEEIWKEIVRRKEAKANEGSKKKKNISVKKGKKKNRLRALAEVIDVEDLKMKEQLQDRNLHQVDIKAIIFK